MMQASNPLFTGVRGIQILGSSHLAPVTGIMLTVEAQPANPKRAGSRPYPGRVNHLLLSDEDYTVPFADHDLLTRE
jgi:hypothetical protein